MLMTGRKATNRFAVLFPASEKSEYSRHDIIVVPSLPYALISHFPCVPYPRSLYAPFAPGKDTGILLNLFIASNEGRIIVEGVFDSLAAS